MPFFLISDTICPNQFLKKKLIKEILNRRGRVAYISATPQITKQQWYLNTKKEYKQIEANINVDYFDLSQRYSDKKLQELPKRYGMLHLSGGSSFKFLTSLRQREFRKILTDHISRDGLVIGVCAGGIVLTPTIQTITIGARYEKNIEHIENYIKTTNFTDYTGLNLFPFEFYPHFQNKPGELDDILLYSKRSNSKVYICTDSDGIFVKDSLVSSIGHILFCNNGELVQLDN